MDFLKSLDNNSIITLVLLSCGCCVVIIVLGFGLQIIGTVLGFVGSLLHGLTGLFGAGPLPGCGCIIAAGGCGIILLIGYFVLSLASSCGTHPTNFCTLIGR